MKSQETTFDRDVKPRATALEARLKTETAGDGLASAGPAAQCKHRKMIDRSPYVTSQRKRLADMSGQTLQKQAGLEEEEELMQGKSTARRQPEEEEELLQGRFADLRSPEMEDGGQKPIRQKPDARDENRTGMPDNVKARMEDTFGADFSDVRVHPNSGKAAEIRAQAYTRGTDVHFAPGQFTPLSSAGQQLLGHELTHVVQQRQGRVRPTGEVAGMPLNDSPALENEADAMGKKIIE